MLPALSIIVPSFNQAGFIEETLLSIISQQYPGLELIVIDGGSTDGSVDIIRKYESHIAYWVSEPDRGQSHAINKGLARATGEWVAWMNSDDCYLPGALHFIFSTLPHTKADFLYGCCTSGPDMEHRIPKVYKRDHKRDLFRLLMFFHSTEHIIPSQSVFLRKALVNQIGNLNEAYHYAMDLDWYARVFLATKKRIYYTIPVCFYRKIATTKTATNNGRLLNELFTIVKNYAPKLKFWQRWLIYKMMRENEAYRTNYLQAKTPTKVLWMLIKFPIQCSFTIHFKGLLKQSFSKRLKP